VTLHDDNHADAATRKDRRSGQDRRQRRQPRLRERRSGFDRRHQNGKGLDAAYYRSLQRLRRNSLTFWTALATIVVFNFLDLMLTLRALDRGAHEANPVMRALFWTDPIVATLIKLGTVAAVVLGLQRVRRYRDALSVTLFLLVGFTALMFYHAGFALGIIG
jgi:hypothetical protein